MQAVFVSVFLSPASFHHTCFFLLSSVSCVPLFTSLALTPKPFSIFLLSPNPSNLYFSLIHSLCCQFTEHKDTSMPKENTSSLKTLNLQCIPYVKCFHVLHLLKTQAHSKKCKQSDLCLLIN